MRVRVGVRTGAARQRISATIRAIPGIRRHSVSRRHGKRHQGVMLHVQLASVAGVCVGAWACAWRVSVAQRAYVHVRIRTPTASKRRLLNEKQPCASQPSGVKTIIAGRLLSVGKASRERLEHEFDSLCIGQPSQFTASKRRETACRADAAIWYEFFESLEIR